MSVNEPEATRTALDTVADSLIGQDGGRGLEPREHARLRATAVLQNALILTDPHQEDNPIVYHNPAFETLTGYSALEIVGRNCRFLQGPDTDPNAVDELRAAIRDERKTQITIKNYRKDGIAFWNELTIAPVRNDDGALTHFVGVQTDVTAIREAEEALRISEERFRSLVAGVKDYAIFMLDPEGRVMTWNAGGEVIKGYMAEEVLGKHFRMLYPESDAAAGKPEAQLRTALEEGRAEDRGWRLRKDGSLFWANVVVTPVYADNGELRGFAKIVRDITDLHEAQLALEAAYEHEHHIASALQESLLLMPPADTFPGLAVQTLYEPASSEALVGGDFCDAFALDDQRVAVMVGDVSGKGLSAAARTAEIKYTLRAFLREVADPSSALARLNNVVLDGQHLDKQAIESFICACVAVIDTENGNAVCAAAGMEGPIHARIGKSAQQTAETGLPLGASPKAIYTPQSVILKPGDLLVMTTDGITEARQRRRFFGMEGVRDVVEQAAENDPLEKIGHEVIAAARSFSSNPLADDCCLMLVRRL